MGMGITIATFGLLELALKAKALKDLALGSPLDLLKGLAPKDDSAKDKSTNGAENESTRDGEVGASSEGEDGHEDGGDAVQGDDVTGGRATDSAEGPQDPQAPSNTTPPATQAQDSVLTDTDRDPGTNGGDQPPTIREKLKNVRVAGKREKKVK